MLKDTEKRAAQLAVSRYGADQAGVRRVCKAIAQARSVGQAVDLLDMLVQKRLLVSEQASALRLSLDTTHFDLTGPEKTGILDSTLAKRGGASTPLPDDRALRALGNYRLLRLLGEGGMGAVYLGYEQATDQKVAIKILAEQLAGNQASLDRFLREGRNGAMLNHPNIVRNITGGQDKSSGLYYLVLEYVDGPSAQTLLDRQGKLGIGDAVSIALDIGRALEHAHSRSIIHRDIKPGNILLTHAGVAKLSDLGLAKRIDVASHLTGIRQGFGTPYYMPYEQALNARKADARSDIFALGATLYHLITGEVPFPGDDAVEIAQRKQSGTFAPVRSLLPDAPAVLDHILAKMMRPEPEQRYQTATQLIADLLAADLAEAPGFRDVEQPPVDAPVRHRTHSGQPTNPDLPTPEPQPPAPPDHEPGLWWYLRYRDAEGHWCKTRATTKQVVQRMRLGRLSGRIEASRKAQGDFRPLAEYPEFKSQQVKSPRRASRQPVQATATAFLGVLRRYGLTVGLGTGVVLTLFLLTWALVRLFAES